MHTNSTPNYDLPQFLGTDQPDFVGDFNPAFLQIDTTMKANESAATKAESIANGANTKADSAVQTANNAIMQIGAVETKADNAVTTANNAQNTANNAQTSANEANETATTALGNSNNALEQLQHLNLSKIKTATFSITTGSGTITSQDIKVVYDASESICKIYGALNISNATSQNNLYLTSNKIFDNIPKEFIVAFTGMSYKEGNTAPDVCAITFKTNGTITISTYKNPTAQNTYIQMYPFLIFMSDFGDSNPQIAN